MCVWKLQRSRDSTWRLEKFWWWHHQIFIREEEREIAKYILPGHLFTDTIFRAIAIPASFEKARTRDHLPKFDCLPHFIPGFKDRNKFSSRRGHLKRRPQVTIED
jgi:hypothetical protein